MPPPTKQPGLDLAEVVVIAFIVVTTAILVGSLLSRVTHFMFR